MPVPCRCEDVGELVQNRLAQEFTVRVDPEDRATDFDRSCFRTRSACMLAEGAHLNLDLTARTNTPQRPRDYPRRAVNYLIVNHRVPLSSVPAPRGGSGTANPNVC